MKVKAGANAPGTRRATVSGRQMHLAPLVRMIPSRAGMSQPSRSGRGIRNGGTRIGKNQTGQQRLRKEAADRGSPPEMMDLGMGMPRIELGKNLEEHPVGVTARGTRGRRRAGQRTQVRTQRITGVVRVRGLCASAAGTQVRRPGKSRPRHPAAFAEKTVQAVLAKGHGTSWGTWSHRRQPRLLQHSFVQSLRQPRLTRARLAGDALGRLLGTKCRISRMAQETVPSHGSRCRQWWTS
mmetsp:Transcript_88493/g.258646  ORF Transcript_88493/g.258646 Transcript_88493/m.258646 type:complete len:238 (+) Transcript_88493:3-716(+)